MRGGARVAVQKSFQKILSADVFCKERICKAYVIFRYITYYV